MPDWNYALPNDERFKMMSDVLYTYLFSISYHNPIKRAGRFIEQYNYIYLDKDKNGKKYNVTAICKRLGFTRATYYRKFEKLQQLDLIEVTEYHGRPIIKLPYIDSERVLNVKTCAFLSKSYGQLGFCPEDLIKILCLLKIYYCSDDKTFTTRVVKASLGYSLTNKDKDLYVHYALDILRGLDLIDFTCEIVEEGCTKRVVYTLTKADDSFNERLQTYEVDMNNIQIDSELTTQEIDKVKKLKI